AAPAAVAAPDAPQAEVVGQIAHGGQQPPMTSAAAAAAPAAAPADGGRHDAVPLDQSGDHTPPQPHPTSAPTGRRRRVAAPPAARS
ncbi:hypothetical protein JTP67_32730, partial [Streptomyces sp. S12]|nr:hypothetical protein [Streptomyces sp. S12]